MDCRERNIERSRDRESMRRRGNEAKYEEIKNGQERRRKTEQGEMV